ncbi:hypothetical protein [Streptomyces melanogenes]|uniref:Secreted protein n=1 Tax=Streptomyces melanogenes TaxID=67326 RepID=A0ABZ1XNH5_9ACTN|nr:hypothetical protein [Streptomyces melanogenes]
MRRAALIGVSAAATLALGGTLAACGGEGGKPYVAVGEQAPSGKAAPPHGKVELVPLDGASATSGGRSAAPSSPQPSSSDATAGARVGTAEVPGGSHSEGGNGSAGGDSAGSGTTPGTNGGGTGTPGGGSATGGNGGSASGGSTSGAGSSTGGGATTGGPGTSDGGATTGGTSGSPTPTPAALTLGTPTRTPTPTRWCETVTIPVRNTGGTPVKSGTLTFATHIIGLLGIDWATITTTQPLAPVPPRTATSRTYTVCVDAWRVPLGMHIETRSVTADWR